MRAVTTSRPPAPIWGILSVVLAPLAVVFAYFSLQLLESIWGMPFTRSFRRAGQTALFLGIARTVLMVSTVAVAAGLISALVACITRERQRWMPVLGIGTTVLLVGLLRYFSSSD